MSDHPKASRQSVLRKHAALFDEMGSAIGLDLEQEVMSGRLPIDEVGEAVLRCTRCAYPERCSALLHQNGSSPFSGVSRPPSYCRNRDLLSALNES